MKRNGLIMLLSLIVIIFVMITKSKFIPHSIHFTAIAVFFITLGYTLSTSNRFKEILVRIIKSEKEARWIQLISGITIAFGSLQPAVYLVFMNYEVIRSLFQ